MGIVISRDFALESLSISKSILLCLQNILID